MFYNRFKKDKDLIVKEKAYQIADHVTASTPSTIQQPYRPHDSHISSSTEGKESITKATEQQQTKFTMPYTIPAPVKHNDNRSSEIKMRAYEPISKAKWYQKVKFICVILLNTCNIVNDILLGSGCL